jgi:N-acetylglucosaminyl-diphospho-decaprenol L-rhamnosyltransferase
MTPERTEWSVVIVNFDAGDLLVRCVASVMAQDEARTEVIIIDNASSDGSADRTAARYPAIRVLRNEVNAGFPKAVNQGIEAARGHRILILNPDAELSAGVFRAAALALEPTGPYDLVTFSQQDDPALEYSTGALMSTAEILGQVVLRRRGRARLGEVVSVGHESFRTVVKGYLSGYCLAGNACLLRSLGGFDHRLFWAEDVDLCARAVKAGAVLGVCTSVGVVHDRSYTRQRNPGLVTFFQFTSKIGYARRHSPRSAALITAAVTVVAALRWARMAVRRRDSHSADKARGYLAVLHHVYTRGWRRPEGWDPQQVALLRQATVDLGDSAGRVRIRARNSVGHHSCGSSEEEPKGG